MGSPSKEMNVVELFFGNATKHWHFEEILRKSKLSRSKANKWLSRLVQKNIIRRVKPKGKMPHYVANFEHPAYRNSKKIYALRLFYETGFLNHLMSLPKAKTVIIFGSFARADWYADSDIDLFVYGDDEGMEKVKYERKLKHDIQIFTATTRADLQKFGPDLVQNILKGYLVQGDLDFFKVELHA
jgi:predicted nucleotidyltransferase